MTIQDTITKIEKMEQQTKDIQMRLPKTVHSNDEITLTYSELLNLMADRQELIDMYKRMEVMYK